MRAPFEREKVEPPSVRIYLAPSAIAAASDDSLAWLGRVSELSYFNVTCIPVTDASSIRCKASSLRTASFSHYNDFVTLTTEKTQSLLGWKENFDYWLAKLGTDEEAIERLLLEKDDFFDIAVVASHSEALSQGKQEAWNICDLPGLATRLRLYQVANSYFEPFPHCHIDKSLYLMVRRTRCFPTFLPAWIAACCLWTNHPILSQLSSLNMRLAFACNAADHCQIESLGQSNMGLPSDCLYHLTTLVLLSTGALEDLAWLLHRCYPSSIHLQGITLRSGKKGQSKLLARVEGDNHLLWSRLAHGPLRTGIEGLFALRDQLQHRGMPRTIATTGSRGRTGHIVVADAIISQLAGGSGVPLPAFDKAFDDPADRMCDPFWLSSAAFTILASVINTALPLLPWEDFFSSLPFSHRADYDRKLAEHLAAPFRPYSFGDPDLY